MANKKRLLESVSLLAFLTILFMVVYLGNAIQNFENIEDRLHYAEPILSKKVNTQAIAPTRYSYIPAYSHIYVDGGKPLLLETTLSIRNTDPEQAIVLHQIHYYDTKGALVRSFIDKPVTLPALASAEYLKEKTAITGGSGASFTVRWSSERAEATPLIEAIMIGSNAEKSVSFTSRSLELPYPVNTP